MKALHNSYNTVTRALPDMSTFSPRTCDPWASGVHTYQAEHSCLCYNY